MIDSHAHLIWDSFSDIDTVLERAVQDGITKIIHPCVELADIPMMQALQEKYPQSIHLAVGIHPCHADTFVSDGDSANSVETMRSVIGAAAKTDYPIVAIGETGLDYFHQQIDIETQSRSFIAQGRLAGEAGLPLIIHCRDAFADTYDILSALKEQFPALTGVMHCYTGDYEWAMKFISLDFYISWSGCLTYKRSVDLREAACKIPLEKTLLETDAPFLAPQTYRGQRNEPAYMIETAKLLAELRAVDLDEIDQATTQNTKLLFGI